MTGFSVGLLNLRVGLCRGLLASSCQAGARGRSPLSANADTTLHQLGSDEPRSFEPNSVKSDLTLTLHGPGTELTDLTGFRFKTVYGRVAQPLQFRAPALSSGAYNANGGVVSSRHGLTTDRTRVNGPVKEHGR